LYGYHEKFSPDPSPQAAFLRAADSAANRQWISPDQCARIRTQRRAFCRGLEIDGHLNFRDLLHRPVGRLIAAQNAAGVAADEAERIAIAGAIAHESTSRRVLAKRVNRGNPMAVGQGDELIARADKERVGAEQECASSLRDKVCKGLFDLGWAACSKKQQAHPKYNGRTLQLSGFEGAKIGVGRVAEKCNFRGGRHQFVHELQALRHRADREGAHAGHIAPRSA
jgi:hypothetical protein